MWLSQHCGPGGECHSCTNLAVHATYESSYDDQSDASLTESDLESQTSAGGSSTKSSDDLEIEILTKMDDIDYDWT